MKKPQEWEPWWDDEVVEFRYPWRMLLEFLIWNVCSGLVFVYILYLAWGTDSFALWFAVLFLGLFVVRSVVAFVHLVRSPYSLRIEGPQLIKPQGQFRTLAPCISDLRRYTGIKLYADIWPERKPSWFKANYGGASGANEPFKAKWAVFEPRGRYEIEFVALGLLNIPDGEALAFLSYRMGLAKESTEPTPDFAALARREPPIGIEVIGKLPHDTAWWDADTLGLRANRQTLFLILGLGLIVAALVSSQLVDRPIGDAVWHNQLWLAAIAFFALMSFIMILRLAAKHAYVISKDRLLRRTLGATGLRTNEVANLARVYDPAPLMEFVDGNEKCMGVKFTLKPGDEFEPRTTINAMNLLVDSEVLAILVTYRIAKAKGENPPPPNFS